MASIECRQMVELVTDYLEGAMSAADARRLERHLETCPGCAEYLAQMREIAGSLEGLTEESIPAAMRDDLIAASLPWIILGGGSRSLKVKISPEVFRALPGATVTPGLVTEP